MVPIGRPKKTFVETVSIADELKIPILTYHSIDSSGSVVSTSSNAFRQQISFFSRCGYRSLKLGELAELLSNKHPIPPKAICLTFDDGFENFLTDAFPVLQEYGFSATVFLVTEHCGKYNDWAGNPRLLPRGKLLSWTQIKELAIHGIEFGSHTLSHRDLTRLSAVDASVEITRSKFTIEAALGKRVRSFAYPFGRCSDEIVKKVREDYAAACTTDLGMVGNRSDVVQLERIDAYYLSHSSVLDMFESRRFQTYLAVRQMLRTLKRALTFA